MSTWETERGYENNVKMILGKLIMTTEGSWNWGGETDNFQLVTSEKKSTSHAKIA
jgi:hypothetical protein